MSSKEYHREYHREYNGKRYHTRKAELVSLLGGVCSDCGSSHDLEFDHIETTSKSFIIAKLLNYSKETVLLETFNHLRILT
jgi:hypothetical protein